jgi:cytochrome c biogenesis protein CcmG/thiol:disulfide interchange protein DsbE
MMREPFHQQEDNETRTILLVLAAVLALVAALSAYVVAYGKNAAQVSARSAAPAQQGKSRSRVRQVAPAVAEPAPDFALKDIAGNEVKLSDFKGKVVVINFWATWCGPCRFETPWLVELREQYKKQGFEIIGVSVDSLDEYDPAEVSAFIKEHEVKYPIVMATKEMVNAFGPVTGLPTTIVIDRQGKIRHRHRGLISFDDIKGKVVNLL